MSKTNNILIAAIGGAVIAAVLASYLGTEKGKQTLSSATDMLKDLAGKAAGFAEKNMGNFRSVDQEQHA